MRVALEAEISRVEDICRFDGYVCSRHLCCFSRFYSDFECPRFVKIAHLRITPRFHKPDLNGRLALKCRSDSR